MNADIGPDCGNDGRGDRGRPSDSEHRRRPTRAAAVTTRARRDSRSPRVARQATAPRTRSSECLPAAEPRRHGFQRVRDRRRRPIEPLHRPRADYLQLDTSRRVPAPAPALRGSTAASANSGPDTGDASRRRVKRKNASSGSATGARSAMLARVLLLAAAVAAIFFLPEPWGYRRRRRRRGHRGRRGLLLDPLPAPLPGDDRRRGAGGGEGRGRRGARADRAGAGARRAVGGALARSRRSRGSA